MELLTEKHIALIHSQTLPQCNGEIDDTNCNSKLESENCNYQLEEANVNGQPEVRNCNDQLEEKSCSISSQDQNGSNELQDTNSKERSVDENCNDNLNDKSDLENNYTSNLSIKNISNLEEVIIVEYRNPPGSTCNATSQSSTLERTSDQYASENLETCTWKQHSRKSNNLQTIYRYSPMKVTPKKVEEDLNNVCDKCGNEKTPIRRTQRNTSCTQTDDITAGDVHVDCSSPKVNIEKTVITVKLRKKNADNQEPDLTNNFLSQSDHIKRRSTEISELRRNLEARVKRHSYHPRSNCFSDDEDYHTRGTQTRSTSPRSTSKRPTSAFGYFNGHSGIERASTMPWNQRQLINSENDASFSSTPTRKQLRMNSAIPPLALDPVKLNYLLENNKRTSKKGDERYLSPKNNRNAKSSAKEKRHSVVLRSNKKTYPPDDARRHSSPLHGNVCSNPYDKAVEEPLSQYHTPVASPKKKSSKSQHKIPQDYPIEIPKDWKKESDGRINFYPNCDATVWLRSCKQEVLEPLSGVRSGVIPKWLRGSLIRNGPGRIEVGDQTYNHLFDGSALLHRFHFKDGNVTYQNSFLKSKCYLEDTAAQRIVVNYFGTRAYPDPCKTIMQNIASKFTFEEHFNDNAQISLYPYGDGLYALTETPFLFRVDPETLNTHERVELTQHVAVFTHTAHPHIDIDGTVYNIGQGVGPFGPKYHICKFPVGKVDSKGKTKSPFDQAQIVGSMSARWRFNPCYMHSFAMTDNYWVIIEQPLVVSVPKILKTIVKQDALIDALQWWEKETKIHVLRRDTGSEIATEYVTETFFFLHTINAYEDRGHIVLDIAVYKNAEMLHCMYVEALKDCSYNPCYAQMFRGRPKRWVLPLRPAKDASPGVNLVTLRDTKCHAHWVKKNVIHLTPELLADIGCEVPRINYDKYNGRQYQYFYAICSDVDHPNPGTLVKVDVVKKTHIEWSEDNIYPAEPVFVPHPNAQGEDDGVVISALLRAKGLDNQVCCVVLDAKTFTELGRVEFVAPGPVPKCLHGWYVPEGTLTVHKEDDDKN